MTRRGQSSLSIWLLRATGGVAILLVWEIVARHSRSLLLPTVMDTARALATLVTSAELWTALALSNEALAIGFALSLAIGGPVGFALGRSARLDRWVRPYLSLLLVLPTSALVPVVFILGGLGLTARATVVCLFALPIVVDCARMAIGHVDPRLCEMARMFGATPAQQWRTVILPGAVPGMMTGVRLGLARAVEGMVVIELLLVAVGVGRLLLDFQARFDAAAIYALVIVVLAEAALLTGFGRALERRFARAPHGGLR